MRLTLAAVLLSAMMVPLPGHAVEADTLRLAEVTVTAPPKADAELLPLAVSEISGNEVRGAHDATILPTLTRNIPGLFSTERGIGGYGVASMAAGTISIRGIGGGMGAVNNRVLFLVDGLPQWAGVFGHNLPDTYTTGQVERVEIVRGPSSLLYGSNAMGGSINVITRRARFTGWQGGVSMLWGAHSTQRYSLNLSRRTARLNAFVDASYQSTNGHRANSSHWLASQFASLGYAISNAWNVSGNVGLTQTTAHNPGMEQKPLEDMWTHLFRGTASIAISHTYSRTRGALQAYINWGRHRINDGHYAGEQPRDYLFHSTDHNAGLTLHETLRPWKGADLSAGFDFKHWGGRTWQTPVDGSADRPGIDENCTEEALYAMLQQDVTGQGRMSLNAGVRWEHSSQFGSQWIPQAGFVARPWRGSSFKFSYGKGFRSPNIRELYIGTAANPDLRPESLQNYEVELRQTLWRGILDFGVALYFIDADNLIMSVNRDGRPVNLNVGSVINRGFEIDFTLRPAAEWELTSNYSYLDASRTLTCAPRHKLFGALSYCPGRFRFVLESLYVAGLHVTDNAEIPAVNYALVNLRAELSLLVRERYGAVFFLKGENITDTRYETIYGFPMPGFQLAGGLEIHF